METCTIDRRQFLGATGGLTLGFVLGALAPVERAQAAEPGQVNSWLNIGADDSITLTVGASEMGQGSLSGLAQILAEDLMVDFSRVEVVQGGPTLASPAPIGTAISTVGSGVTKGNYWKLRDAGAIARETLVAAAMGQIGDDARGNYSVSDGVILHTSGETRTYGQVAADAALLNPSTSAALVPASEFRSIGKSLPRADIPLKVDGSAKYGLDTRLPGMVYAVIKHCPTVGGTLASTPSTPSGAIAVIPVSVPPGNGRGGNVAGTVNAVAVVAATTWDAMRLAGKLNVKWTLPPGAGALDTSQFIADGRALSLDAPAYVPKAANGPGTLYTVERVGDAADALDRLSTRQLDAIYTLPYVSHACMEVLNCTVDFVPGQRCDVYAPTQVAKSVLTLAVNMTGLSGSQVNVHTTFLGGGLGRKAEVDFVGQALQVGMALKRPVQLAWPREEDFTHDQYRPMAVVRARAGLDSAGNVTSWIYRNVSPSIAAQRGSTLGASGDGQGSEGSQGLPYSFGSRLTEWVSHPSPVPVGYWRSVGASINTFVVESMIDELATAAGEDPLQFRRENLTNPRWLGVVEAAAQLANWAAPPARGSARGIAVGTAFNSIVATVVEVSGSAKSIRVNRVSVALDSYLVVNPANVQAQLAGGVVHGLNAALYGQQTFTNGAADRKNFNVNRMIRLQEMPEVNVVLIPPPAVSDRKVAIGGVGELGVPTLAPALANAVFRLTGQRIRSLPFYPDAKMSGL